MPGAINKIRLNGGGIVGMNKAINAAMKSAEYLSDEVIELGGGTILGNPLIKEDASLHLAEQEKLCAEYDAAQEAFYKGQNALNDKRRKWLDTKL